MPKKPKKTREEQTAENYFPVEKEDLKRTTEKSVKEEEVLENFPKRTTEKEIRPAPTQTEVLKRAVEKMYSELPRKDLEIIEKINTEKNGKKNGFAKKNGNKIAKIKAAKKAKITTLKESKEEIPKSLLKENGYELIITEKPQAASKISAALGEYTARNLHGVPFYEVTRNGKKIIVACAVGHLFTLKQNVSGSEVPVFDVSWVPNFEAKKGDFSKKYYDTLVKLAKNAAEFIVATDFDVEGEVIGINVVKMICKQHDANRMKFSTLTDKELNQAYENKTPTIHWGQAIAGETRHYLDWYYGINLSRALMNAIKKVGRFKIMSVGRVQGPTLNLIVQKELEIKNFKSEPYWQVYIKVSDFDLELKYTKDIFNKKELEVFENIIGKEINLETKKTEQILEPNPPMNLTTLQTESYRLFGITPASTLKTAQSLYLAGLISYPRTSSQKLPDSIDYNSILDKLKDKFKAGKFLKRNKPIEGVKTDPAHPSIYPTGNFQVLTGDEQKIYDLIVRRFLALFCENALIERKRIAGKLDDKYEFSISGSAVRKKGWLEVYPIKVVETELPDVSGKKKILNSRIEEKQTQPPKRYSQASIISELEKRNLGTKATRASILETLYDRGYIKEKSIEATPLGISLIETLQKYSPIIIDEELTEKLQDEMDSIVEKNDEKLREEEQEILETSRKTIRKIIDDFKDKEEAIGKELIEAQDEQRAIQRKENILLLCSKCEKGNLIINYSKKFKRYFVACDSYPDCRNTLSLPPGNIKKTGKICEQCNYPLLISLRKEKKPWIFCFNPECPSNKERLDAYREKKEREEKGE